MRVMMTAALLLWAGMAQAEEWRALRFIGADGSVTQGTYME